MKNPVRIFVNDDGSLTPVIDRTLTNLRQTSSMGQNFLRIGEESTSQHAKGDFDWVIWTNEAAYTPAQISGLLPAALGAVTGY